MNLSPVKTGLVGLRFGAGLVSMRLFGTDNEKFVNITAVCDLDQAKADAFAAERGIPAYYDLDKMLADADIEAVMLMTPPAGRTALIRKCLAAGKHVMTTKPFELNYEEALAVLKEAQQKKLAVHLNSPAPYPSADLQQIRQWQQEFDLGMPVSANWETYIRYNEQPNGTWFDDPERCPAAPIFRIGIYGINELIAIFGKVKAVNLFCSRIFTGRPTPDHAQMTMQFENGAIGSIFASFCIGDGTLYPSALTLHFEKGTIRKTQVRRVESTEFTEIKMSLQTIVDGKCCTREVSMPASNRSGEYQFEMFWKSVREGIGKEMTTPEEIAEAVRVVNMMAEAERNLSK